MTRFENETKDAKYCDLQSESVLMVGADRHDLFEKSVSWLRSYRYAPQSKQLSPSQWLIAQLIACGLSDKEIAFLLGVAQATVKAHNGNTLRSLGLFRRSQLVRYLWETGQFNPEAAQQSLAQRRERPPRVVG